ncbi:hypothetical protein [Coleofasciculus sp. E1-EBD-02]|uniref:hypothetical protein n=1 Tax=Coleofasciculus sp. E1-EBD-02 TaxID=3068481 RepID=UPI0032F855AB
MSNSYCINGLAIALWQSPMKSHPTIEENLLGRAIAKPNLLYRTRDRAVANYEQARLEGVRADFTDNLN